MLTCQEFRLVEINSMQCRLELVGVVVQGLRGGMLLIEINHFLEQMFAGFTRNDRRQEFVSVTVE